jgi:type VI secretion system protein ImpH
MMISRADPASPLDRFVREPFRFDFFQAVRMLALAASAPPGPDAAALRTYQAQLPGEQQIRFRAHVGLAFPASTIGSFAESAESDAALVHELTVTFMGLAGTGGVLPLHYTQAVIDRVREKDLALRDFLDLFNHRLIWQFYRAWERCRFFVGYEFFRRGRTRDPDWLTQMLFSLVGLGTPGLRDRQANSDEGILYYAGHFAHRPRSAVALEEIVSDSFELPTTIEQFRGQWMRLNRADQTRLRAEKNNQLGVSAVAGHRVWGIENKIRIRLGPLTYEQFLGFLPGRPGFIWLSQLVRFFVGPALDFDLQLVLRRKEIPRCRLSRAGLPLLGWNTWLFNTPAARDVDDAVFACEGSPTF